MAKKPGIALSVRYCAKCGKRLTPRSYEDGADGVRYETCECPACGLTWQTAQFPSGEVRIAEVSSDEGSPDQMVDLGG